MNLTKKSFNILILIAICFYLAGTIYHALFINVDDRLTDQSAYMTATKTIYKNDGWYLGDRGRMPLYPYIQAIFYTKNTTDHMLFLQGKIINIILSVGILTALYKLTKDRFDRNTLFIFILSASLLFITKSAYFQVESIYYFFLFLTWFFIVRNINTLDFKKAVLIGILIAVSYLFKSSGLTLLMAVIGYFILNTIIKTYRSVRSTKPSQFTALVRSNVKYASVITAVFFLTVSPYLVENKIIFGRYFYNVNTTFYAWYDNWNEVSMGTKSAGDRVGWPNLPAEEIPSPQNYLQTHSSAEIINRSLYGAFYQILLLSHPTQYSAYIYSPVWYLFPLLGLCLLTDRKLISYLFKTYRSQILFSVIFFAIYFTSLSWFTVIVPREGNRFILALYLPLLFSILMIITKLKDIGDNLLKRQLSFVIASGIVFVALMYIIKIYPFVLTTYMGE